MQLVLSLPVSVHTHKAGLQNQLVQHVSLFSRHHNRSECIPNIKRLMINSFPPYSAI